MWYIYSWTLLQQSLKKKTWISASPWNKWLSIFAWVLVCSLNDLFDREIAWFLAQQVSENLNLLAQQDGTLSQPCTLANFRLKIPLSQPQIISPWICSFSHLQPASMYFKSLISQIIFCFPKSLQCLGSNIVQFFPQGVPYIWNYYPTAPCREQITPKRVQISVVFVLQRTG